MLKRVESSEMNFGTGSLPPPPSVEIRSPTPQQLFAQTLSRPETPASTTQDALNRIDGTPSPENNPTSKINEARKGQIKGQILETKRVLETIRILETIRMSAEDVRVP